MQKKPSFWNYVAGGCLTAALGFIIKEYADISKIGNSDKLNLYYIPLIIGVVLLAIAAFVRQPRALAFFGFISMSVSSVTGMIDTADTLKEFSDNSRQYGFHFESSEEYYEMMFADYTVSTVVFVISIIAVAVYDSTHRGKDALDKPFGKFPVCIPIIGAIWKVIYKLMSDDNDSLVKYVYDYIRNDTNEFVGQLLLFIGIAFFFAWLAYPVQVGSSYNASTWQTPNEAMMRTMQTPPYMPPQTPPQNGQYVPPQPPQFMPLQFMTPQPPQDIPPQNAPLRFEPADVAELQWYQTLLNRGSITPEEYAAKQQELYDRACSMYVSSPTVATDLQWYQTLLNRGSITPEEYEQKRQQLMRQ